MIDGIMQLEINDLMLAGAHAAEFESALQTTVANISGDAVPPDAIKAHAAIAPVPGAPSRLLAQLSVEMNIFLTSPSVSRSEVEQRISAYSPEQLSSLYNSKLSELSVDVSAIGVSVSGLSLMGQKRET